jgi:hypothetical protein
MVPELPKASFQYASPHHSSIVVGKERRRLMPQMTALSPVFIVFAQNIAQLRADCDTSGLVKLCASDHEGGFRKIHIGACETKRLTDTKPCPIEQQENGAN